MLQIKENENMWKTNKHEKKIAKNQKKKKNHIKPKHIYIFSLETEISLRKSPSPMMAVFANDASLHQRLWHYMPFSMTAPLVEITFTNDDSLGRQHLHHDAT